LIKSREKNLAGFNEDIKIAYPDRVQNITEQHQLGKPGEHRKIWAILI
jgi:hypothetical protein